MTPAAEARPYANNFEHLADELRWLDLLIGLRASTLTLQSEWAAEGQVPRAAYITPAEVKWLLGREGRGEDLPSTEAREELTRLRLEIDARENCSEDRRVFLALPQLCRMFALSGFERLALVICLAPELRRKYDRLYAFLQDDIVRQRPSVDLVLDLICDNEEQKWSARKFLSEGAPLRRAELIRSADDPQSPSGSSGLAQFLRLDARIVEFLSGEHRVDSRLAGLCRLLRSSAQAEASAGSVAIGLYRLIESHMSPQNAGGRKLALYLHGPYGVGKLDLALQVCGRLQMSLLTLDAEMLIAKGAEAEGLVHRAFREGLMQQAFLYVEHSDVLSQEAARPLLHALQEAALAFGSIIFLAGNTPWLERRALPFLDFYAVELPMPDEPERAATWSQLLIDLGPSDASWPAQLAGQFRLTAGQIRAAVELARTRRLMDSEERPFTMDDFVAACREQSSNKLRELAVKVTPHSGWRDLILPDDKVSQLREICNHVRYRYQVFGAWGFDAKWGYGKGLSVLLTGPSGTGKTMAAEVLAGELGLDLYKVDLASVVSKYIGETEKNLSRIFAEADGSNAILFFDEADALFGKRTEVSDAHDRYANIETSFLLQKMEAYEGIVILATNLRENMDEAFTRRIRFIVEFPFPDEGHRQRIWQTNFPAHAPVASDVDCERLAREYKVSGGSIKNVVLSAAFLAAGEDDAIGVSHIQQGARREFEKMGKHFRADGPGKIDSAARVVEGKHV